MLHNLFRIVLAHASSATRQPMRWSLLCALGGFFALVGAPAAADIYNGAEASVSYGTTTSFSPGVYTQTDYAYTGGLGYGAAALNQFDSVTDVTLTGHPGIVNTPLLKSKSIPMGDDTATQGWVGAMAAFQYVGAGPATISFQWYLDAVLVEPVDTAAFLRARAGLVTSPEFFTTNLTDFLEGGGTIEDSMNFTQNFAGVIDETGTLTFEANPGDVFHLVMGLQTYGGRFGAMTNAYDTFYGEFSASSGTIIPVAVPEPNTAVLGAVAVLTILTRLRRRSQA